MRGLVLSPVALVAVSSCTVLLYSILLAVYRLLLHPLAGFPGPKVAALTKWYEFYFDILKGHGGQYAFEIKRLHEIYGKQNREWIGTIPVHLTSWSGPVVRINPEEIHINDPDWHETLYANNPTRRDKWPPAAKMLGTDLGSRYRQRSVQYSLTL